MNNDVLRFVVTLMMLPAQDCNVEKLDNTEKMLDLMQMFKPADPLPKTMMLRQWTHNLAIQGPQAGYLNHEKYEEEIIEHLLKLPFFKRFNKKDLVQPLKNAKPEYFRKDEIIFTDGHVGVITHGSVLIRSHAGSIMEPQIEAKYEKGRILGHESDDGITSNPQNWLLSFDEGTEVLFFPADDFEELWRTQLLKIDKQLMEANIECNHLLHQMSDQSQFQLIYEDMEIRKYHPGQLICRMSKRSRLNRHFENFTNSNPMKVREMMHALTSGPNSTQNMSTSFVN